jgi:phthalate 4,5-cis-dihydrodiol dehydrogenase
MQQQERRLRVGVVGLGGAAAFTLPSLLAHPQVVVAAAADPNPEARKRFEAEFGGRTFENGEALCAADVIDAVYIATPHQRHVEDAQTAARHGKHILVEKPMALSTAECEAMVEAADRHGVHLIVGHTHAFDPAILAMRNIIESGELGRLRMITNLIYNNFIYRPRRPEELDTRRGGGILYNQVPHAIEIARGLTHAPLRSVRAVAGIWDETRPTEGAISAFLEFHDGVAASIVYNGYDHLDTDEFQSWVGELGDPRTPDTHGEARRALRAGDEAQAKAKGGFAGRGVVQARGWRQPHFGLLIVSCERGDMRPSADGVLIYDEQGKRELPLPAGRAGPFRDRVVDELVEAALHGKRPLHDGRWGMATVAATEALMLSARERREVVLSGERPA